MVSKKFKKLFKPALFAHTISALFLTSCSQLSNQQEIDEIIAPFETKIDVSRDSLKATITTDSNFTNFQQVLLNVKQPISVENLLNNFYPNINDSTLVVYSKFLSESIPEKDFIRSLTGYKKNDQLFQFTFEIDTT